MGKKRFDDMPNGQYRADVKTKQYFARVQGTEVWVRLLKIDLEQLKQAGHKLEYTERPEGTYVTIEQ